MEQLKFSIQGLTGNPSVNLGPSTVPGTGTPGTPSGGSVTSIAQNSGTQISGDIKLLDGTSVAMSQSGNNIIIGLDASLDSLYIRLDGGTEPTASIGWGNNEITRVKIRSGISDTHSGADEQVTVKTLDQKYGWMHHTENVSLGSYVDANGGWIGTETDHPLRFFTGGSGADWELATDGTLKPTGADNSIGTPTSYLNSVHVNRIGMSDDSGTAPFIGIKESEDPTTTNFQLGYDHTSPSEVLTMQFAKTGIKVNSFGITNDWNGASSIFGKLVAIEGVTTLDELKAADGDYDMNDNAVTGLSTLELNETTAPGAGAPDTARLYTINNGGKTELYVQFQTGSPILLATEV
jgi:hypothetical protein